MNDSTENERIEFSSDCLNQDLIPKNNKDSGQFDFRESKQIFFKASKAPSMMSDRVIENANEDNN